MMASLHPEFDQWMVMTGYGRVLSRRGLEARQRELAVLPVLADQRAWPQLESHAAGAYVVVLVLKTFSPALGSGLSRFQSK